MFRGDFEWPFGARLFLRQALITDVANVRAAVSVRILPRANERVVGHQPAEVARLDEIAKYPKRIRADFAVFRSRHRAPHHAAFHQFHARIVAVKLFSIIWATIPPVRFFSPKLVPPLLPFPLARRLRMENSAPISAPSS